MRLCDLVRSCLHRALCCTRVECSHAEFSSFFFLLLLLLLLILFSSNRHSQCAEPRGSEEESQVAIFTVSRTRLRRLRFYYLIKKKLSTKGKKKKKLDCSTSQSKAGPNTPVAVVEALEMRSAPLTKSAPGKMSTQRRLNCTTLLFCCRSFSSLPLRLCLPADY